MKIKLPKDSTTKKYQELIAGLFDNAKKKDPREFIIANLYYNGIMQINDSYDSKSELDKTIVEFFRILESNRQSQNLSGEMFLKLLLLLYCHILEFDYFYIFIYGLLDITKGNSFDVEKFSQKSKQINPQVFTDIANLINNKTDKNPNVTKKIEKIAEICRPFTEHRISNWKKINEIRKLSDETKSGIAEVIVEFYDNEIRNAFSHLEYTISGKGLFLLESRKLIPMMEIYEKVIDCFHFYQMLSEKSHGEIKKLTIDDRNKKFKGRYGSLEIRPIFDHGKVRFAIKGSSIGKTL